MIFCSIWVPLRRYVSTSDLYLGRPAGRTERQLTCVRAMLVAPLLLSIWTPKDFRHEPFFDQTNITVRYPIDSWQLFMNLLFFRHFSSSWHRAFEIMNSNHFFCGGSTRSTTCPMGVILFVITRPTCLTYQDLSSLISSKPTLLRVLSGVLLMRKTHGLGMITTWAL